MPKENASDETHTQSVLAAFANLGREIAALQQEATLQRERADDWQREAVAAMTVAARLHARVAELEAQLQGTVQP